MVYRIGLEYEITHITTDDTEPYVYGLGWDIHGDCTIETFDDDYSQNEYVTTPYIIDIRKHKQNKTINKIVRDYTGLLDTLDDATAVEGEGLHIHISGIKNKAFFYSREFYNYVYNEYKKIAKSDLELSRLDEHCARWKYQDNNICDDYDRYTAINIERAYEKHNTFEFRFLPATDDPERLRFYLKWLMNIVRKCEYSKHKDITLNLEINEQPEPIKYTATATDDIYKRKVIKIQKVVYSNV